MPEDRAHSIGTENETSLHAALKHYIDPDPAHHEVPAAGHIADVLNDGGAYEIQTRGFYRLRAKVEHLLTLGPVTVVYPAAAEKRLFWIDPETGDCTEGRKSSKRCTRSSFWTELPALAEFLGNPRFAARILLLELDEYRMLDGRGASKKARATHVDRVLRGIRDDYTVRTPDDLLGLLPEGLPERFTSLDFSKAAHIPRASAQAALRVLYAHGLAGRESGERRGYTYKIQPKRSENP